MIKMEEKIEETKEEEKPLPELKELVERLETANKESREIQQKQEDLIAKNLIGGNTDAGIQAPEKKEETPAEYKDRVLKGNL